MVDRFVGRTAYLDELSDAAAAAPTGRAQLVLVSGEPGAGKSRLVREAVTRDAARVAWATCWEADGAPAFWPWIQLVRCCLRTPGGEAWRTRDDPAVAEVLALLPEVAGAVPPDASRFRLFEGVIGLLAAAAGGDLLAVVVDDLQRADEPSLRLLAFVLHSIDAPVLLVGVYRDTELPSDGPLAAVLGDLAAAGRELVVTGLSVGELAELAREAFPDVTDETVSDLHRRTGGNPFFAVELLRLMRAHRGRDVASPRWAVPGGARSVVDRRLARLSQPCHDALRVASVLGSPFDAELLGRCLGVSTTDALGVIAEAVTAHLVVETPQGVRPGFTFAHDLVRETLYDSLGPAGRAKWHGAAAEALQAMHGTDDGHVAELAHHLIEAAVDGDADRAAAAAERAGRRALALLAYEEAADWFDRAAALLRAAHDPRGRLRPVLLARGEALLRTGRLPAARKVYQEVAASARRAGDAAGLAHAALGLGSGLGGFEVGLFDQAQIDLLEEALTALGPDDSPLRAWVLARLAVALSFVSADERRRALSLEGIAVARRTGDPVALGYALAGHCDTIAGPAHIAARITATQEAVELALRTGDRRLELLARRLLLVARLESADIAGADAEIAAFARVADVLRDPLYRWYVPLWRGMRELMRGRIAESAAASAEAAALGELAGSGNARMLVTTQEWVRRRVEGRFTDAAAVIDAAGWEDMRQMPAARIALALVQLHRGDADAARTELAPLAARDLALPVDAEWLPAMAQVVELVVALGDRRLAGVADRMLAPYDGVVAVEGIGAAVYGTMGGFRAELASLLGRPDEAARLAADADAVAGRIGLVSWVPLWRPSGDTRPLASGRPDGGELRREGDVWALTFAGTTVRVRDSKGMRDLATLLGAPGRAVHVTELTGSPAASGSAQAVLDRRALAEYRNRLAELDTELSAAAHDHDAARLRAAEREREFLLAELTGSVGLGGRSRSFADPTERARKAVSARVHDAIDRIDEVHPALGRHLAKSVRTGAFCVYEPEHPVRWAVAG